MYDVEIFSEFIGYEGLVDEFGEKKIQERYEALFQCLQDFIKKFNYEENVRIDKLILTNVLFDYFADISRLKAFHKIENVNEIKILSYEIFWLLRRKPLQLLNSGKDVVYVNEQFAFCQILHFLNDNDNKNVLLIEDKNKELGFYMDTLYYYLKYRFLDPQAIEFFIVSFLGGQKYQELLEKNK
ncbi:hypothetical protein FACS1894109_00430 [Spirochaetia bacterium]|nr:hypothetical protein FACS1894109_00430 [Spirochaetia bacterium]